MSRFSYNAIKYSIVRYFRDVGRNIYNPEEKKILNRTKRNFVLCILFYIIFYISLASVLYIVYYVIEHFSLPNNATGPSSTTILKTPYLVSLAKSQSLDKYNSSNYESYKDYVIAIDQVFNEYKNLTFKSLCTETRIHKGNCKFDPNILVSPCNKTPYGFDTNSPCLYFRVSKIFNIEYFNIQVTDHYIPVSCTIQSDSNTPVNVYPSGGFLIDALPFNGNNIPPMVAISVPRSNNNENTKVLCKVSPSHRKPIEILFSIPGLL